MTVAVLLLTAGRVEFTRRTLESFSAQNPDAREQFLLLHADDASVEPEIAALAQAHGFAPVVASPMRRGYRTSRKFGIEAAAARGADWVLVLENDWEWVRPFPWALFHHLVAKRSSIYNLRLYGEYKERGNRMPCFQFHLGQSRRRVTWRRDPGAPEPCEVTRIHWGGPPSVTRTRELLTLVGEPALPGYDGRRDSQPEVTLSGRIDADVARVLDNVVYHIGHTRTEKPAHVPAVVRRVRPGHHPPAPVRYTPSWQARRAWTSEGSSRCLDLALEALPRPTSLLDVGCGDGHLVRAACQAGIDAIGVDLSASGTDDGAVRHADLREPLDLARTFDLVLCWEVAEHLPEASAGQLCDTLVRHLAPGGTLLFTAAHPGQGGDGHLNERPAAYWTERLAARGLVPVAGLTQRLAAAWTEAATRTPWYGANLRAFRAPGAAVVPDLTLPTLAITLRTANRAPHPNYVGGTVARLVAQGVDPAAIHVCATDPETTWLRAELQGTPVTLHVPTRRLTPNENGLAQIRVLDPAAADWVLLLEDDLVFCQDFIGSVRRWLLRAGRPDRNVYRFFSFRIRPPGSRSTTAYDWPLKNMCGTQAVALRMPDAQDFLAWADLNLETWGGFRGNPRIAFDKLMAAWALHRWPDRPGVMSHPLFVQHIGDISSIHPRAARNDAFFAGARWTYQPQEVSA